MPSSTTVTKYESRRDKKKYKIDEVLKWKFLGKCGIYSVFLDRCDESNSEIHLGVFKKNEFYNAAQLEISHTKCNPKRGEIDYIYVRRDFRGKKLATKLYSYLITQHNYVLISGSSQSPGGKYIWRELSKDPAVDICLSNDCSYSGIKATTRKFRNGAFEARNEDEEDIYNRRFIARKNKTKAIRYL